MSKKRKAAKLLQQWANEDSNYDEKVWSVLKKEMKVTVRDPKPIEAWAVFDPKGGFYDFTVNTLGEDYALQRFFGTGRPVGVVQDIYKHWVDYLQDGYTCKKIKIEVVE